MTAGMRWSREKVTMLPDLARRTARIPAPPPPADAHPSSEIARRRMDDAVLIVTAALYSVGVFVIGWFLLAP